MENITDIINALPMPTWNHLGVNGAKNPNFPVPAKDATLNFVLSDGIKNAEVSVATKADAALEDFIGKNANIKHGFTIGKNVKNPLYLNGKIDENQNIVAESTQINVEEDANVTIYHTMEADKINAGYYAGSIKVKAEKNSSVCLVLTQLFSDTVKSWSSLVLEIEEGASVDVIRVLLGAENTFAAVNSKMLGDDASFSLNTYYQTEKNQLIDANDIASHIGKRTNSDMNFIGIMKDSSSKIYRGTIDFHKGAVKSKGRELDNVLLMSPNVHNRTCPLILCGEENVEGEHAATIGRFNDEQLFYLCSRGLTESVAKQLLVDAKLNSVVGQIEDRDLAEKIIAFATK